jgi:DNA-binding beta-propeller fold protein YncE
MTPAWRSLRSELALVVVLTLFSTVIPLEGALAGGASTPDREARVERTLHSSSVGISGVAGITSDPVSGVVYLIPESSDRLVGVSFDEETLGTLDVAVAYPSNAAIDSGGDRLLSLSGDQLLAVDSDTGSTQSRSGPLDLSAPKGLTIDAASGDVYILEPRAHQIHRVGRNGKVDRIELGHLNRYDLDGLAFNPADGLLYVAAPEDDLLLGLHLSGQVAAAYGLGEVDVTNLSGWCLPRAPIPLTTQTATTYT